MRTAVVSTRIDPELKENTTRIFKRLGISTSQAITLFLKQVELRQGLPFPIMLPTAETEAALKEAQTRQNLLTADTPEELFDELGI